MSKLKNFVFPLFVGVALISAPAIGQDFNVPSGDLRNALEAYMKQTGVTVIYSPKAVAGRRTHGISGSLSPDAALSKILSGTGLTEYRTPEGDIGIVHDASSQVDQIEPLRLAQAAAAPRASVETVTVTSSKLGGADVQSIPIAITALSQEQLTATQTAGGPDLVKQVPNLTFTKTNFTGYSIQIRGIGTQAISVTTDPAVAVAENDVPFIRNHFFEQEFYDLSQAEVLRGPQGTLYGRNATAGVVNLITAKPTDQFEAMASAEVGSYHQRRLEGMINLPIVDDRLDIRLAGEWTKRQGYSFNETTNNRIDGRDLWSGRLSIAFAPFSKLQTTLVWEHFQEDDDRLRSAKQTCKRSPTPTEVGGVPVGTVTGSALSITGALSQGCSPTSFYTAQAFEVPNGFSLPYYGPLSNLNAPVDSSIDPYAGTTQSTNLRRIQSILQPIYKAKSDIVELNLDYYLSSSLMLTSQTGYNGDFLYSAEDYNRFDTAPGIFIYQTDQEAHSANTIPVVSPDGYFCDPQLGCSNRLVAEDLATEHSWQFSQEFRLASRFPGPFNFSVGANFLHYETDENYYVFINTLSALAAHRGNAARSYTPGVTDNADCLEHGKVFADPTKGYSVEDCIYIDPNPISRLNNEGHNYFLSQNPYGLNSYAGFGELYYQVASQIRLTGGARWTSDQKHFPLIPSWLLAGGSYGYPVTGTVDQRWDQWTGRLAVDWTPFFPFTDHSLIYGSYAHGYKAGGANPPPPIILGATPPDPLTVSHFAHPLAFKPEFVDAFELGTKNTLLDNALTLNGGIFYYNYENYQISQIVDRSSINLNFDAHIKGAELEATYELLPGLQFNLSGGYEDARFAAGSKAIDLMDRTAGNPDWTVIKPFATNPSNCIVPVRLVAADLNGTDHFSGTEADGICETLYIYHKTATIDGEPSFDPATAPQNGEGFYKDLSHNQMPNAPPFTLSFGAQYSLPLSPDWVGTLRSDFYWQSNSYWRVFNDLAYDKLHGYTNVNLTLILTSQAGWQVMLYDKNLFNKTAITGAFLNSDDTALTTNVFLTDPRLLGIRITKNW